MNNTKFEVDDFFHPYDEELEAMNALAQLGEAPKTLDFFDTVEIAKILYDMQALSAKSLLDHFKVSI